MGSSRKSVNVIQFHVDVPDGETSVWVEVEVPAGAPFAADAGSQVMVGNLVGYVESITWCLAVPTGGRNLCAIVWLKDVDVTTTAELGRWVSEVAVGGPGTKAKTAKKEVRDV